MLLAVLEHLGIDADWCPRLATGFAAGIAGTGLVCGAISGAMVAAGSCLGRDDLEGDREELFALGQDLIAEFQSEYESVSCKILTGLDLTKPEVRKRGRDEGIFAEVCAPVVEFCAGFVADRLRR